MNRRRPVLQLGQKPLNRHTPDKDNSNNGLRSGAGLGLLGSYGDDSDEGQTNASDDISDDEVKLPKSTLDSKVADFLKEIDNIESSVPSQSMKSNKKKEKSDVTTKDASNGIKIWGDWQQLTDEATKHQYYWNTVTNEVSWTLPKNVADKYKSNTSTMHTGIPSATKQIDKESKRPTSSITASTKSKAKKIQESPVCVTSLKAAILENKKAKDKQKAIMEKASRGTSRSKLEAKTQSSRRNDIDIDAELDSVLAKDSKRKNRVKLDDDVGVMSKKRKKSPLPETDTKETKADNSVLESAKKTADEEEKGNLVEEKMEMQAKTDLWSQWEKELSQKDQELKDKDVNSDDVRLQKQPKVLTKAVQDDEEDNDLSKYDMMAMDESSNGSSKKICNDDNDSNMSRNVEDCSVQSKTESLQETTEDVKINNNLTKVDLDKEASVIFSRLGCFEMSQATVSPLHQLFTETEVRLTDWKAGALSSEYFKLKLDESIERLSEYEKTVMPKGWLCHWDSLYKRYYYTNKRGRTQWDFPKPDVSEEQSSSKAPSPSLSLEDASDKTTQQQTDVATSSSNNIADTETIVEEKLLQPVADAAKALSPAVQGDDKTTDSNKPTSDAESAEKSSVYSSATPYAGVSGGVVDYNAYNMQNYYWNMSGYNMQYPGSYSSSTNVPGYDESFRNSPMHDQPPPPPGEEVAPLPPASETPPPPPLPPGEAEEPIPPPPPPPPLEPNPSNSDDGGIEMEISDAEEDNASPIISGELKRAPVEYTSQPNTATILTSAPVMNSADTQKQLLASKPVASTDKLKKMKKVKKEKAVAKKPPKQMFGMVAKWQKAQQELEDEEKRLIKESEAELDREMDVKQRIEKWKMDQLESGKASLNANFQPVSDDWKKRVKMRKNRIT